MNERTPVVISDVRIPFFRLMLFFIKVGLAAIPAIVILIVTIVVVSFVIAAVLGGTPTLVIRQWM